MGIELMECPKCKSTDLWDNRPKKQSGEYKKNAPDFKCKDCKTPIWLEKKKEGPIKNPYPPKEDECNTNDIVHLLGLINEKLDTIISMGNAQVDESLVDKEI